MDGFVRRTAAGGMPASRIVAAIESEFGCVVSRNAIIGRCYRKGIPLVVANAQQAPDAEAFTAPRGPVADGGGEGERGVPAPSLAAPIPEIEPDEPDDLDDSGYMPLDFCMAPDGYFGPTRFIEARSNQCKWFATDSSAYDAPVCGEHALVGLSYCEEHAKRVHTVEGLNPARRRALQQLREQRKHQGLSMREIGD